MGLWYWLGVTLGLGVALGAAIGGLFAPLRAAALVAATSAALCGYGLALVFLAPLAALSGVAGGAVGGGAFSELCRRTLTRGGTRAATALLLLLAALGLAGLAFAPVVGYLEAVLAVLLGLRLRRGGGDRYAGLRTLARD
ncbi:MAG: hypothetical protein ABSC51_07735 [Gaiellaceae bacterium]